MSADNGIYILATKDQYRVVHLQGVDNPDIFRYNPTFIVKTWGKSKFTRNKSVALNIATKWEQSLMFCEYGVNIIWHNKTWAQILKDARGYIKKELKLPVVTRTGS